jgi:DNA-directed RNA polymerase specialized sigma24 family protein
VQPSIEELRLDRGRWLERFVRARVPEGDREDVEADIWMHVAQSIRELRDGAKASAWLRTLASRRVCTYLYWRMRRRIEQAELPADLETPSTSTSSRLGAKQLRQLVRETVPPLLRGAERAIYELFFEQRRELSAIVDELRALGLRTSHDREYDEPAIRRAIKRAIYPHLKRIEALEGLAPRELARILARES